MPSPATRTPSRDKVRNHRQRLRDQGMRPIQIWSSSPDVRAAAFRVAASRQAKAVAASRYEADDQAFIDSLTGDA